METLFNKLNENEIKVLLSLYRQIVKCTGGEFGFLEDVERGEFSKYQFAGYISALDKKGIFEYLDNYSGEKYQGQYAIKENIFDFLNSAKTYQNG